MCVIINIEDGQYPSYDTLKSAESLNSHGGSIAWLESGKINYHKGISSKKINNIIEHRLKIQGVKTAIIHFRIASVGTINNKLCHPFQISNNVDLDLKVMDSKYDLLFHNGTVTNWQEILIQVLQGQALKIPSGELSDSRIMAFLISHFGHEFLKDLSKFNKFSILTKNGIVKYGDWVKVDNNECSNDHFVKKDYGVFDYNGNWWEKYQDKKKQNSDLNNQLDEIEANYDKIANKVNNRASNYTYYSSLTGEKIKSKSRDHSPDNYIKVKSNKSPINKNHNLKHELKRDRTVERYYDDFGVLIGRKYLPNPEYDY